MEEIRVFCENVRGLRRKHKIELYKMAKILGISTSALLSIETRIMPDDITVDVVFRIQKYFGIHPKDQFLPLL